MTVAHWRQGTAPIESNSGAGEVLSVLRVVRCDWVWWHMPIIPTLKRLEEHEFAVILGYTMQVSGMEF